MQKKISFISLVFIILIQFSSFGQGNVGIGTTTPDGSAILDLSSDSMGLLIPTMTTTKRNLINPAQGLLIYNTTESCFNYNTALKANTADWKSLCGSKKKKGGGNNTPGVNTSYTIVTDVRMHEGILQKKQKTITLSDGIITEISEESNWK